MLTMESKFFYVWFPFLFLVAALSTGVYWSHSHTSKVSVNELRWTLFVGLQNCADHQPGDRFFMGAPQEIIQPCRWVWSGLRMSSGYNTTPSWPNLKDLDERTRVIFKSEFYEAKLKPCDFPNVWYYASSNVAHYELFLEALLDTTKNPRVTATFGQVESVFI